MTQKTVVVQFWTVETSQGWLVLYQIDDDYPIPLHGKPLSDEARANRCICIADAIVQKSLSTYKQVMGWPSKIIDIDY